MSPEAQLERLLKQHKFKLVAHHKHLKYQNPEGKIFITAKTPSDWRAVRNAMTMLKQVIARPVPTSAVLEEEQQRKTLEASIALAAQRKATVGMQGAGKKSRSNGTGFVYVDKAVPFKTEEQKELDRTASKWVALRHRLLTQARLVGDRLVTHFISATMAFCLAYARLVVTRVIRETRKRVDWSLNKYELRALETAIFKELFHSAMSMPEPDPQHLLLYWQTGDAIKLHFDRAFTNLKHVAESAVPPPSAALFQQEALRTMVTLFEGARPNWAWLLPREVQPPLPHIRRAFMLLSKYVPHDKELKRGFDALNDARRIRPNKESE